MLYKIVLWVVFPTFILALLLYFLGVRIPNGLHEVQGISGSNVYSFQTLNYAWRPFFKRLNKDYASWKVVIPNIPEIPISKLVEGALQGNKVLQMVIKIFGAMFLFFNFIIKLLNILIAIINTVIAVIQFLLTFIYDIRWLINDIKSKTSAVSLSRLALA